jgi:hypothetical protein
MAKRPCRATAVEHVRAEHRRLRAFVTEQLLDDTSGIAVLQEVRGKAMAEGVAGLHIRDEKARPCRVMVGAGAGVTEQVQSSVESLPLAVHRALPGPVRELASHFLIRRGPPREGEQEIA